jgi:hypothetical protein
MPGSVSWLRTLHLSCLRSSAGVCKKIIAYLTSSFDSSLFLLACCYVLPFVGPCIVLPTIILIGCILVCLSGSWHLSLDYSMKA